MLDFLKAALVRIHNEPVLLRTVVGGAIALLAIFGITVQDGTLDPVIDVAGLIIAFLVNASARAKVTPV